MIDPVCFTLFGRPIYWYGVFLALGFGAGLLHLTWLGRREGRESGFASDLTFWLIMGGIVGARIAYVLGNWSEFANDPGMIVRVDKGGLVFYGGFFGALFAALLFARMRREPILKLFDYTVTALPLGHALGRIGCFVNGCCQGRLHDGWLACTYPAKSAVWWAQVEDKVILPSAHAALPVWPVQLFEAAGNLAIYAILFLAYRRRHASGSLVVLYFLLYPLLRFSLEFLRGDLSDRVVVHGLSSAQWVSIGMFATALLFAWILRLQSRHAHTHRPA
jgi:phosphatidylglycerol:prolipoprotein diacylglycerol transferase